jgi:hypothetical protein
MIFFQAFDQQQQDLVDAASKALSYRQDIVEENVRLTHALQVLLYYWNGHGLFACSEWLPLNRCSIFCMLKLN